MTIILVTGPARSGKSEWAEHLADELAASGAKQVVYIATARTSSDDAEWQARIEAHIFRRPEHWLCQEVPVELSEAIAQAPKNHCLLVDSLGTWLANLIEQSPEEWEDTQQALLRAIAQTHADIIFVAEETGWGVVPAYELGRTFRDRLGSLSRNVGAIAADVYLVTSGYAISLSELGQRVHSVSRDP